MTERFLILGIGNDILGDDGIGPRIAGDLSLLMAGRGFRFEVAACGGLEILDYITGFEKVIIIDAIKTGNGTPGSVYHFLPSAFRETLNLSNLHDINFITALELGEKLGLELPREMHIIAVEITEDSEFKNEFSGSLKENYNSVLKKVQALINEIAKS